MQEYWRRYCECPFYETNNVCMVQCEVGKLYFDTKEATKQMLDTCVSGYRDCPIYQAKQTDYDERERIERENKQRVAGRG